MRLWWPNPFRLLLSTLAYPLIEAIRRIALKNTELAQATCATIRLKLFKTGLMVIRNTRRIRLRLKPLSLPVPVSICLPAPEPD
ncbi:MULTISPECIES: transposase [Methylobacter]|jgi:Transposase DDE domain group 1|uniref:transposase n=1 Tax=Methylobacter TaxID=429 RepID=UPI00037CD1AC|nr:MULTISPECIES: transposase [Methylobacter]